MCTLVVLNDPQQQVLVVAFNRDELRDRLPARPPERFSSPHGRFLAPTDASAGGTWIGVTDRGLAIALLNWFGPAPDPDPPVRSRGQLVRQLLELGELEAARSALRSWSRSTDLRHLPPFEVLLAQHVDGEAVVGLAHWNGRRLRWRQPGLPLIWASSAWRLAAVRRERRSALRRLLATGPVTLPNSAQLQQFFADHTAGSALRPVCVHSPFALTVSHTQLRVGRKTVSMRYAVGSPCTASPGAPLSLSRRG